MISPEAREDFVVMHDPEGTSSASADEPVPERPICTLGEDVRALVQAKQITTAMSAARRAEHIP
jgi:hypothetical protein